ncbi:MAG: hypothetical protein JWP61_384 [Friedmanniella sp.]|nr:hypothetical protein [Friedmanniella sp.]
MAAGPYDEVLRNLVAAYKERQALHLTPVLGRRLALSLTTLLDGAAPVRVRAGPVLVVPVPSAAHAVRERGFDATGALARRAARLLPPAYAATVWPVLVQRRGVADQAGLGADARSANLRGAVRLARGPVLGRRLGAGGLVADRPPGAPVVLVDDVVTTGSSLAESARVLRAAGYPVLGAATVGATLRRPRTGPGGLRSE